MLPTQDQDSAPLLRHRDLDLFLFSTDTHRIRSSVEAGVAGIIVDWERIGKRTRQRSADTQIGRDTLEDLERVRASTSARVICRINNHLPKLREEAEAALCGGADEILLPMVRSVAEVETALGLVGGRAGLGILIETVEALEQVEQLARLPLSRVYVGLNDLAIERGTSSIFSAVSDGTVERIRTKIRVPFGFGGLTLPDRGVPIPCRLLMGEMARLACDFTFLRRSFHRDTREIGPAAGVAQIARAFRAARERSVQAVERDRVALGVAIRAASRSDLPGQVASAARGA
jgi:hypothetical protein